MMVWVDYAILAVIALSAVISMLRGFVREALSLAAWIVAFWVALAFSQSLAGVLSSHISMPSARLAAAFAILFLSTLAAGALLNYLAGQMVKKTGLSGTDRMLGVLFGLARGIVIVAVLVLMAGLTPLPRDPWWNQSLLLGHFQALALWLRDFLPADIAASFVFN